MQDKIEQEQETTGNGEQESNVNVEWSQINEQSLDEWGKSDIQEQGQMSQQPSQQSQQAWGEQRGGYRGRGSRRGNSNGYSSRGRGGGYQQNGRGGSGGVQGNKLLQFRRNDDVGILRLVTVAPSKSFSTLTVFHFRYNPTFIDD